MTISFPRSQQHGWNPKATLVFPPFSFCCHGYIAMRVAILLCFIRNIRMYCLHTEMEVNVLETDIFGGCVFVS